MTRVSLKELAMDYAKRIGFEHRAGPGARLAYEADIVDALLAFHKEASRSTEQPDENPGVDGVMLYDKIRKCVEHQTGADETAQKILYLVWPYVSSSERESGELPSHASTGLDSFVTRLEKALYGARPQENVRVSPRDLHDILYHFIRLDNAERQRGQK